MSPCMPSFLRFNYDNHEQSWQTHQKNGFKAMTTCGQQEFFSLLGENKIVFTFYSDESLESFVNVMKKFSIAKILISLT